MSIINDALKKAEQACLSKSQHQPVPEPEAQSRSQHQPVPEPKAQPLSPHSKEEMPQNKSRRFKFTLLLIAVTSVIFIFFLFNNLLSKKDDTRGTNAGKKRPRKSGLFRLIQAKGVKVITGLNLSGIVFSEEGSWAIINDRIVRVGDTVGGAKLLVIKDASVELSRADKKFILNLKD